MKNRQYKAALFAASILLLASCSQSTTIDQTTEADSTIEFSSYIHQTRASIASIDEVQEDGFHVWIAQNTETNFYANNDKVNFLYNEPVVYNKDSHTWDYINKRFWPSGDKALSFFALSPSEWLTDATYLTTTHQKIEKGAPVYTFETPAQTSAQVDLLASQVLNRHNDGTRVIFHFKHMLSKIGFDIKTSQDVPAGTTVTLKKFEVFYAKDKVYNKGLVNLNDLTNTPVSDSYFSAVTEDINAGVLYEDVTGKAVTSTAQAIAETTDKFLMLIPQVYDEGDLYAKISYVIETNDSAHYGNTNSDTFIDEQVDKIINLPIYLREGNNVGWEQGKQYTYNIEIGLNAVDFNGTIQVLDWGEEIEVQDPTAQDQLIPVDGITYESDHFVISNANGLAAFSDITNGDNLPMAVAGYTGYITEIMKEADAQLSANIDLSTKCSSTLGSWSPIGTYSYSGEFDGNGYNISNLYIQESLMSHGGLFATVGIGSHVHDLTLVNPSIEIGEIEMGGAFAGALAGFSRNTLFENCHVQSTAPDNAAYAIINDYGDAAGLVGRGENITIMSCSSNIQVRGTSGLNTGGLLGTQNADNTIVNSYVNNSTISGSIVGDSNRAGTIIYGSYCISAYGIKYWDEGEQTSRIDCADIAALNAVVPQMNNGVASYNSNHTSKSSTEFAPGVDDNAIPTFKQLLYD